MDTSTIINTEIPPCDTICRLENIEIHTNVFDIWVHTPSLLLVIAGVLVSRFIYRKYKSR